MESFSQRQGFKPLKKTVQIEGMDEDLRNSLWNALCMFCWSDKNRVPIKDIEKTYELVQLVYIDYFKKPLDQIDYYWENEYDKLKRYFFSCAWFEVYDFIEFVARCNKGGIFKTYTNAILERELSAYRVIGEKIVPITSDEELSEIEKALQVTDTLRPISIHLRTAIDLLADRKSPDYRNSIKESISAVEAICILITGKDKAELGEALKAINDKIELHPALRQSFIKLYGYTSDAQGIRHALLDEPNLGFEDAKFMLVSCSAFINYLKEKANKAGVKL